VNEEVEDFDTYLKKMMMPKALRKVNPNLLKLIPRTTANSGNSSILVDIEENIKPTENQKELIRMKWNLKRMETEQKSQMNQFKKIKRKISPRKLIITEKKTNPMDNVDETTFRDSLTKASNTVTKNERYSKIVQNDDKIGEDEMKNFQKQMTMPLNIFTPKSESTRLFDEDNELTSNGFRIDEIVEDMKSSEDDSVSDSEAYTKKQTVQSKKNTEKPQKWSGKEKRGKFFVHKAKSFMKPKKLKSINPTKNINDKLASSKRKINMIKLNSTAFKNMSVKRIGDSRSPSPLKGQMSDSTSENFSNGSPSCSKSPQNYDFKNAIISPIRWDGMEPEVGIVQSTDFVSTTEENDPAIKNKLTKPSNCSPPVERVQKATPSPKKINKLTIKPTQITTKRNVSKAYAPQAGSNWKQRKKKKSIKKMFSEEYQLKSANL